MYGGDNNSKKINLDVNRCKWKDNASCIVLFLIWCGHMGDSGMGNTKTWIGYFANPVFFIIAGFFANKIRNCSYFSYVKHTIKRILIPYIIFAIINILYYTVLHNHSDIRKVFYYVVMYCVCDVKDGYEFGGASWFLVGLFVVRLLYEALLRLTKSEYKTALFASAVSLFMMILKSNGINVHYYAVSRGLFWFVFYAIGPYFYRFFCMIHSFLLDSRKKVIFYFEYLVLLVFGGVYWLYGKSITNSLWSISLKGFPFTLLSEFIIQFLCPLILSMFLIETAFFFESKIIEIIGQHTLGLCGLESVIKSIIIFIPYSIGLEWNLDEPINVLIYITVCFAFYYKIVLPALSNLRVKSYIL